MYRKLAGNIFLLAIIISMSGCAHMGMDKGPAELEADSFAMLTPVSKIHRDLTNLPEPVGKITASVYGFRDQTGQYKPSPASSFSTAVTQGAGSILVKALLDSKWFAPVEREGLNNLLTERKIIRAANKTIKIDGKLSPLLSSSILLEGGIVGFDSNVKTGGFGARYLGIGASELYRMDQVTVNLRAVDVRTGQILGSVSTTKTIFSIQLDAGVFKFIKTQELLELESGYSNNEPVFLCVTDAIESAVIHLVAQGLTNGTWRLKNPEESGAKVLKSYHDSLAGQMTRYISE